MAHPLFWPGKYFFYLIGNTSAVCLTRDLSPEEPGKILLLGCGDPRNVLYTIFCEPQKNRTLDLTCCDFDPGVLARNVLLYTMLADAKRDTTAIWNFFFHMYLDEDSHSFLIEHCRKLIGLSSSLQHWNSSSYGGFVKMCTEYTLKELRRHWSLYVAMNDLPHKRLNAIIDAFIKQSKSSSENHGSVMTAARSAGPLLMDFINLSVEQFKNYWRTGVTTSDLSVAAARLLNPTFVYSLGGEGCSVHYGTDPLTPFHHAAVFGNATSSVSVSDVVKAARAEFNSWCSAFHTSLSSTSAPIIRFILGEATAVCCTLQAFNTTGVLESGSPIAQWRSQLIKLNEDEYVSGDAPAIFNVIDTSNLIDHIGLLNVMIAALPLLSDSPRHGVIYTESLLFKGQDATKEFTELLYMDITVFGILLGLCPIDYLSGFTARSNTHELIMHAALKGESPQFHQVTTWKSPVSGDAIAVRNRGARLSPVFDVHQLGTLLYDMYHQLFEQEDAMHFFRLNHGNILKSFSHSNLIHYTRETFVLFLKLVRDRLGITQTSWLKVMDRFFGLHHADQSLAMDSVNFNDLCSQLHRHSVYTADEYRAEPPSVGRFANWRTVPTLIRIILTVPREKLIVLEKLREPTGSPPLQCDIRGSWSHNVFVAVHVAFGRVVPMGTNSHPCVVFEEDEEGWKGTSSLVASFTILAILLTGIEPMESLSVRFAVRSTPATAMLVRELGMDLCIFSAKLMDESHVHIVPDSPLPTRKPQVSSKSPQSCNTDLLSQIGEAGPALVELDEQCELVASLTIRVAVQDPEVKHLFGSGTTPQIAQVSPCVMRMNIGSHIQDVVYSFPVIGSLSKLRLARKSLYIEVVVPVVGPFSPGGMKLNPFPVVGAGGVVSPWNIHRVNLSRLPTMDIKATRVGEWLNPHVGSMMSSRERSLRKKHQNDALTMVKDTLHSIFVRSSGIQGGPAQRLFSLQDISANCDTIFFISDLKFDLSSHTMVCDGYVLPLTPALILKLGSSFANLVGIGDMVGVPCGLGEMKVWKQLLPALVERCRSSWKHGENCEYKSHRRIPLSEEMEEDPLCSCGRGKEVAGMHKVKLWSKLAPYVTRVALSPLFAVSYLETVGRDPAAHKCSVCRGKGKPKLMKCMACQKVRYCSKACQKKDWMIHKSRCMPV